MGKNLNSVEQFIFVCNGKDCKKHHSKEVLKSLQYELKRAGHRDSSHIVKTKCMGYCKQAPVLIVKDQCFTKVKAGDCEELVDLYITKKEALY